MIVVYTITKNEEKFIKRWADSSKDADLRVVVDTGSSDNTIQIAKECGCVVHQIQVNPWRFDVARNMALDLLPTEATWCISLDADEILIDGWREEINKVKKDTTSLYYEYTWSFFPDGTPDRVFYTNKIHKRHLYRWKSPIHEILTPLSEEISEYVNIQIHHHPDNTKSRGSYLPLLKMASEEEPNDQRILFYLAREYLFYNNISDCTKECKRLLNLIEKDGKYISDVEICHVYIYLYKCDGDYEWLLKAKNFTPNRREPLVELSWCYYHKKMWKECNDYALSALNIRNKPKDYLTTNEYWKEIPWDLAAISFWNLGKYVEADAYGEKALSFNRNDERLKNNCELYKNKY